MPTPAAVVVEILSAKAATEGEPVFAIVALAGERYVTNHSDKLLWNEACQLTVADLSSTLTIKLKSRKGSYGKFKTPVRKIPALRSEQPAHLPLEDGNNRPAGEVVLRFYVSKWQDGTSSPAVTRASASSTLSGQSTPRCGRHLSVDMNDSESGTDNDCSSPKPQTLRGKVMRRMRSLSASKRTQPQLFSASGALSDTEPVGGSGLPEQPQPALTQQELLDLTRENQELKRRVHEMETIIFSPLTTFTSVAVEIKEPQAAACKPTTTTQPTALPPMAGASGDAPECRSAINAHLSPGFVAPFCGCCAPNPLACLLAFTLPCLTTAQTAAFLEDRHAHLCDVLCCNAYSTRQAVRRRYQLEPYPALDCAMCVCCHCCMVSQTSREISVRNTGTGAE